MNKPINPVRWGILGAARIAENAILPGMTESDWCQPLAIAARDKTRAANLGAKFGVPKAYGSYEELLADPEIEAVYIALPNNVHVEWVRKAADAGKHVLVEKPVSMNKPELAALEGINPDLVVCEAFMVRHQPRWQALAEIIASGDYGQPKTVSSLLSFMMDNPEDFRNKPEFGGGAIYDIGCYTAMAARFAFQAEPKRVFAASKIVDSGIDMVTSFILDFGDGRHASLSVSMEQASAQTLQVVCDRAYIDLPRAYVPSRVEPNVIRIDTSTDHAVSELTVREFPPLNQYEAEVTNFARKVRGEDVPFYGLDDSHKNMAVIDAMFESAKTGAWVDIA